MLCQKQFWLFYVGNFHRNFMVSWFVTVCVLDFHDLCPQLSPIIEFFLYRACLRLFIVNLLVELPTYLLTFYIVCVDSDVRRLIVAMSRARLGLYVFARVGLFQNCFELTPAFNQLMVRPLKLFLAPHETYPPTRKVLCLSKRLLYLPPGPLPLPLHKCLMKQMQNRSWRLTPQETGGDHWDVLVLHGWRPSSRIWNPATSLWTTQLTWLRFEFNLVQRNSVWTWFNFWSRFSWTEVMNDIGATRP